MSTAVASVDLDRLPPTLSFPARYANALVLIRRRGRPVGQVVLPLTEGSAERGWVAAVRGHATPAPDEPDPGARQPWHRAGAVAEPQGERDPAVPPATVAVCTRDRPEDVRRCLESLSRLPQDGQELLVVDSAPSTEATRQVAASFPSVRYVREERPGLDVARNRALREAGHDFVAFIDDDAVADAEWLRGLLPNFTDARVLCVTGLTLPRELETPAQEWFERQSSFGRGFRRRVFDRATHDPLIGGPIGAGVNMAVRRSVVLEELRGFDEALDVGTPTRSGGDYELFYRILAAGYLVVYEPAALCWHRHRRTWRELRRTLYGYGAGVYAAWTRTLLVERQLRVALRAAGWFRHRQAPMLMRALLRRSGRAPLDLIAAELLGCAMGPWAYLISRHRLKARLSSPL